MAKKPTKKIVPVPVPSGTQNNISAVKQEDAKGRFSFNLKLALLLALISVIVYANTLKNGFVLDDIIVTENAIVKKGIPAIPEILVTPYRRGLYKNTSNDLYRPLSLVMFAAEYQFFSKNPAPYHLVNVLLFAGCVILLFLFFDELFQQKKTAVAFIAALLFALHPIHTEVVANVKSRDELLCFFFAFLSLHVFNKYMRSGKMAQLLLGAACYFLSFLSKETVVTFLAVIPLIFFFYRNEDKKRSLYISGSAVVAAIVCIGIRFAVLNHYHANEIANIPFIDNALAKSDLSFESRIATAVLILGYYIKLLFVPHPLICDYSYNSIPYAHFSEPFVLLSLAVYIFLAVFGIKAVIKNKKDPYAFAALFFLITISLFSNIPFLIGTTMGERLLFFPSVGFCLVVALVIEKLVRKNQEAPITILKNKKVLAIIIPLSVIYAVLTIHRNSDWVDGYTLFTTDARKAPDNSKLNLNAGDMIENSNYTETDTAKKRQIMIESISYLKRAVEIYPGNALGHLDIGWAYYLINDYDSAELHEKRAVELEPWNTVAISDLAAIYKAKKKYPQAIELFNRLIKVDPDFGGAQSDLGDAYFDNAQYDSAEVHEQIAIRQNPANVGAINDLAGVYFFRKKYPQAIELYKNAAQLEPRYVRPYTNIGVCYLYLAKYDSAIYYSDKAIAIDPSFSSSYEILAATYSAMNKMDSAKKYESIAQKNNPGFKL